MSSKKKRARRAKPKAPLTFEDMVAEASAPGAPLWKRAFVAADVWVDKTRATTRDAIPAVLTNDPQARRRDLGALLEHLEREARLGRALAELLEVATEGGAPVISADVEDALQRIARTREAALRAALAPVAVARA